ncbi:endonuclease/exonuclease/phosphatase family protein [Solwaraspora sp. WMMD1047]|uniref:endonuclease/exonuclease/phosphatase family protein n=1 Tax=Solwaraspora sp. WMMD1047 TaxID=3016102 RepID=UPI002415C05E|nr:endonuclease/exonuclease/phosphatase family protein [Solwaraspora sp. WMMD1047]MDG4829445.1 endonuclease/exonuclease/phosphatase family protein [Solwaraspora sp. WMMD1047]
MRRSYLSIALLALGVTLLTDVLRVWLPAIITIFGQAASTPAELMGAFALSWFVVAFGAPALIRVAGVRAVGLLAAVLLAGCRLALAGPPGGQLQLYLASVGLLAGLCWLAATAATTPRPVPGLLLGLAAPVILHTTADTYDLAWRGGLWSWLVAGAAAPALVALQATSGGRAFTDPADDGDPAAAGPVAEVDGRVSWFLLGPSLLLVGMVAGSPGLANVALSYLAGTGGAAAGGTAVAQPPPHGDLLPGLLGATAVALLIHLGLARNRPGPWRWLPPVLLVAGSALFVTGWPTALAPAILTTAAGLGGCLAMSGAGGGAGTRAGRSGADQVGARRQRSARSAGRGYAVLGGMLVFAVGAVLHYAAYDLGYPNQWVPPAVAALIATLALRSPATPTAPTTGAVDGRRMVLTGVAAVLTIAGALVTPGRAGEPVAAAGDPAAGSVRLVAYNIRMGFGLDGRFDLAGLAGTIAGQRPDIVALSEVDRAWLLNGGHDTLTLLARRLGMTYRFAPAADPVWGDAVLTRLPVRESRTRRLDPVGAPTGAQALAVVVDLGGRDLVVVATHLQPPPGNGPVAQARELAGFATGFAAGRPLVVAGDLNTEPGEPAFEALRGAGLVDALAAGRPLPTSPSDVPEQEIDHVLTSPGIAAADPVAPAGTASDHLAVAVTLTLPPA